MKLSLEAGQFAQARDLPLQVQSISPAGLIVLTADQPPGEFDERLCGSRAQSTDPLTFVFESNGHCRTLQASLVWIELTQGEQDERRLELIIDTGDEAGWWEVHTAVGED